MNKKETNPKDALGVKRVPFSTVPIVPVAEVGLAMLEGALKYGRHNYRVSGVRSSVYYDAALRHLARWWEGEDIDPDSNLPHITKAIASLIVLRDAQINGMEVDDRPPAMREWVTELNQKAQELVDAVDEPLLPFTNAKI